MAMTYLVVILFFASLVLGERSWSELELSRNVNSLDLNPIRRELGSTPTKTFSVDSYGAKADGRYDDTEAFAKAWKAACSSTTSAVLIVPKKSYLLKPITFAGPCKSSLTVQIIGTIEASNNRADYKDDNKHWLIFENIENLLVQGGGTIDGNGKIWWQNSCKINKALACTDSPNALTFYGCKNLIVENLKIQNAQRMHISFQKCTIVEASYLTISSPESSPNTDGIHVTNTQNIKISNCIIATGDDCISIVSGSQQVQATGITCGPGHGISIGSLGEANSEAHVSDVVVDGAKLIRTTNGVRIKTWQGGSGSASNIKFQNIQMIGVSNPIIIDQNYCDQKKKCNKQTSAVQVKNVLYKNIHGTSASNIAITLNCNENYPCQQIVMQNVNLDKEDGFAAKASCINAKFSGTSAMSPNCNST
ncbi:polygalacturonase-like [Impatiens glandulifera]|uniref:polygalacturonase-like n=1 Tax=Impatiens glandulifera TaxID=253017 RepID=UPI001FB07106|nr:polygalacturonase-like [Impatiens glandulifera]